MYANTTGKIALRRSLGFVSTCNFIVGIIIGTGIFISPAGVLRGVGGNVGWAFVVWIICAILAACGALSYTELASSIRKSGGEFIYIKESFGPTLAFLRIWVVVVIIAPAANAAQALTLANYVLIPLAGPCNVHLLPTAVRLLAACILCFMFFVNSVFITLSIRLQGFLTASKIIGLLIIVAVGVAVLSQGHGIYINDPFAADNFELSKLPSAFLSGLWAYSGWSNIAYVTEEIKKPEKTMARAMITSLIFITIIYFIVNVSYLTVLSPQEIEGSDAVAATFAVRVLNNWSWIIWMFVALSAAGNLNGSCFTRGRLFFAAAREGFLPEVLSMIHIRWLTPLPSMLFVLPTSLFMLAVSDIWTLIDVIETVAIMFDILTLVTIPYFRWKFPNRERPFTVPLIMPFVYIGFNFWVCALSIYTSPLRSLVGLIVTLVGLIFYYIGCRWSNKPTYLQESIDNCNRFLQKMCLSVSQEIKTY